MLWEWHSQPFNFLQMMMWICITVSGLLFRFKPKSFEQSDGSQFGDSVFPETLGQIIPLWRGDRLKHVQSFSQGCVRGMLKGADNSQSSLSVGYLQIKLI